MQGVSENRVMNFNGHLDTYRIFAIYFVSPYSRVLVLHTSGPCRNTTVAPNIGRPLELLHPKDQSTPTKVVKRKEALHRARYQKNSQLSNQNHPKIVAKITHIKPATIEKKKSPPPILAVRQTRARIGILLGYLTPAHSCASVPGYTPPTILPIKHTLTPSRWASDAPEGCTRCFEITEYHS